jgi:hypothetical protein
MDPMLFLAMVLALLGALFFPLVLYYWYAVLPAALFLFIAWVAHGHYQRAKERSHARALTAPHPFAEPLFEGRDDPLKSYVNVRDQLSEGDKKLIERLAARGKSAAFLTEVIRTVADNQREELIMGDELLKARAVDKAKKELRRG